MTTHLPGARFAGAVALLSACVGVAQPAPAQTVAARIPVERPAWPSPPEPARIRFVRSIEPVAVRGRPSLARRLWRAIAGPGETPRMQQPYGIAVGPDRRVYVADTFGHAIHVFDLERTRYSTISVEGDSLIGVAVAVGRLFVTDSVSGRVICLDEHGRTQWTLGPKQGFERPTGIVAGSDRLYVVDTMAGKVVAVSFTGSVIGRFGERGDRVGQFNFPTNIAVDRDGDLYIADSMNFRVQVFDREGRYLTGWGRLGDGSGDFSKPKGVALDSEGHVYVVEGLNDVVQIFEANGQLLLAFGESGAGPGQLWLPTGIAIAHDAIYVADSANRRVQMYEYVKEPR